MIAFLLTGLLYANYSAGAEINLKILSQQRCKLFLSNGKDNPKDDGL
jgi:hypothetical protein